MSGLHQKHQLIIVVVWLSSVLHRFLLPFLFVLVDFVVCASFLLLYNDLF